MSLKAKLVVVGGEVKTAEIKLRLPSTIGRGRGTTIMLPHPLVSRQHCELYEADGKLMVRDLGSLNGTFVNNERITEAPLAAGELLTVGTVTFRAVYDVAEENGAPPGSKAAKTEPRTGDPLARTVRSGPAEPVDLDNIDELGDDLEAETAQDPPPAATFFAGPKASSADKTDTFGDGSEAIVAPKPAKATPAAKPVAAAPPVKASDETTFIPGGEDTQTDPDEEGDGGDEDDLNDFLKSLGK